MPRRSDLPVFPLPLVLLPGELLPLHIFEPRYRELVARCLAGELPTGKSVKEQITTWVPDTLRA